MNDKLKSLREDVLAKIKNERISMHSRTFFLLKMAALALVAILVLTISVFLCNFIFFAINANGSNELLGFGNRGILTFVQIFPWWLLVIDVGLIILLEWLLRRFRFGYKSPVLYLLLGLVVVTLSVGFTVERATMFNSYLRDRAHEHRLPSPLNDIYERSGRPGGPGNGVCRCTIVAIQSGSITADDIDVGTTTRYTIIVPIQNLHATTTGLSVGDVIMVAGDKSGNTINAFGIKKLPPGSSSVESGDDHGNVPRGPDGPMQMGAPQPNSLH
jgi:hypothetical protein